MRDDADFYARLPVFEGFSGVLDPARYRAVPDDWLIGLTDVERSTAAIADGRYKAVNTAGASVIAAVTNALSGSTLSARLRWGWRKPRQRLAQARTERLVRFGLYRQSAALMTCVVPSASAGNHLHFLDGAAGGYALAAQRLKRDTESAVGS